MRHHDRRLLKQFRTTETAPVQCERDGDYFGAWCLFAVAITQGRCPHPTSQPPTVYSRESDWARPQRGQRPQDAV